MAVVRYKRGRVFFYHPENKAQKRAKIILVCLELQQILESR